MHLTRIVANWEVWNTMIKRNKCECRVGGSLGARSARFPRAAAGGAGRSIIAYGGLYINLWQSLDRSCAGNIFFIEQGLVTMSGLYRCHISRRTIAKTWRPLDLNTPLPLPYITSRRTPRHPPPCTAQPVDLHLFLYTPFNKALGLILKILLQLQITPRNELRRVLLC